MPAEEQGPETRKRKTTKPPPPMASDDGDNETETAAEKEMSMMDKLALIDREVRILHEFCVKQGYTSVQIREFAQPLLQKTDQVTSKRLQSTGLKVLAVVVALLALLYFDPAYYILCVFGRKLEIKLLPVWDWTDLYYHDCLVNNPYYDPNKLYVDDCISCEDLTEIDKLSNVSYDVIAEEYIKADVPVIVTDGVDDGWSALSLFDWKFLNKLYNEHERMNDSYPCAFTSNVRVKYGNNRVFLQKIVNGEVKKWFAYWENCERRVARVFRQYFQRPYFLPPMVELAESNWLFISNNYRSKNYKEILIASDLVWFAQLKGKTHIKLTAKPPCNESCSVLSDTLIPGDILAYTDIMWQVEYMPSEFGENIAIAVGGFWDKKK